MTLARTYVNKVEVVIPYHLTPADLVLEPTSRGKSLEAMRDELAWRLDGEDDDVVDLIFRSATLLYAAKAGTYGECLDTAFVWYFG